MISSSTSHKEIRRFGLIAFLLFGVLSALGYWRGKVFPTWLFSIFSLFGLGFLILPAPLSPIYNAWLKVAHFVGGIITTCVLTLAYYLMITPSAFIKRRFGGSALPTKPDKETSSYWVARSEPLQTKERFVKRY